MITVQNLTKTYGEQTVLNIDQLEIPKGQSFGLVGNNGAGKTTLFSLLLDLIQPSSGHVIVLVADETKHAKLYLPSPEMTIVPPLYGTLFCSSALKVDCTKFSR